MTTHKIAGITFSTPLFKWVAPAMIVFTVYAAYLAFSKGNIGSGIASVGVSITMFTFAVGPYCLAIIERGDVALRKIMALITLLGCLAVATGLLIRLFPG